MTQLFNISIDGVDVTSRHLRSSISEEMNRFYDTATVILDNSEDVLLEKDIVINYGSKTFNGFVYAVNKTGKNSLSIECRTHPAKLTEPYSTSETVVDNATTSHTLCALYAARSGIPITIASTDLDFGGSYERNGTMLSALMNIASVTGAEYYDNGTGITIAPKDGISTEGTEVPDRDIFDFIPHSKNIYNNGVGYVTIQNGGDQSSDIVSNNNIYAEIDECSGEIYVFTNPLGTPEYTKGLSNLTTATIDRKEEQAVLDEDVITLDAPINSITTITLNGANITNYNFEAGHNVIYFTTKQRGTISVTYKTTAYKGYTNISVTPLGRFVSFDVFYLDQALSFQGFLSEDCINSSTDGDMTCIVPREMMYPKGFYIWTIGGVPEFTFYANNVVITRTVVATSKNYISVEDVRLEETLTGYKYQTRHPVTTALGARSAGVDVPYTTSSDEDGYYFEFTEYYPKLAVSYETAATEHYVQFSDIPNTLVSMVIRNTNTDQVCEYEVGGIDRSDLSTIPCTLNQNVPVNIASQLGLQVSEVNGESLTYTRPGTTPASATVDEFGYMEIYATSNGDYVVDTSALKARTSITLKVDV